MILWFLTTLYVLTRTKPATQYIVLWKVIITSFKISNCFYLVIFHKKNLRVLSMVTKMYIFWCYTQWRSKDVRGPWTTDSPGPLPILHNLIPLTPPPHTPLLKLCTCLSLYYMILNTARCNQYTSQGVFWKFGSLWWRDGGNGAPWWRNDKRDRW